MANILILNIIIPFPLHHNGNSVRVLPLSRELAKHHRCFLAAFGEADQRYHDLKKLHEYEDILLLPPIPSRHPWWRHLFWRTGNLIKRLHPAYYRECVAKLTEFATRNHIDLVLAHTMIASEFAEELPVKHKMVDVVDSRCLYLQRSYANMDRATLPMREHIKAGREMARARYQESRLLNHFSLATTISSRDSEMLKNLSDADPNRVIDLPNGVSPELEEWADRAHAPERAVCFWGALDFPPNTTAVAYFYKEVFLPYLADSGITWYIIGRNPTPEIQSMAKSHDNIIVTGYLPDLFAFVSRIPIMINPMLIGGGLKNKVLEGFAMRRAVVSNALGMEAIDATAGVHYLAAESPMEFAARIDELLDRPERAAELGRNARELVLRKYTWTAIGQQLCRLMDRTLSN